MTKISKYRPSTYRQSDGAISTTVERLTGKLQIIMPVHLVHELSTHVVEVNSVNGFVNCVPLSKQNVLFYQKCMTHINITSINH